MKREIISHTLALYVNVEGDLSVIFRMKIKFKKNTHFHQVISKWRIFNHKNRT